METLGAVGSIIAIVEFAAKTATVVNGLRNEYRDAPHEVGLLANQLGFVQLSLEAISHLHDKNILQSLQLPESVQVPLQCALAQAKSTIAYTHAQCSAIRAKYKNSVRDRLRWASSDHKKIVDLLQRLRDTQASLSLLLNVLPPIFQLLNQFEDEQIKLLLNEVLSRQTSMHEYLKQQKVNTEPPQQHYVLQRRQPRQQYKAILSLPQQLRDSFGLGLHLSKAEIEKLVTYYLLILQVQYPSISGWKSLRSVFAISVGSPWYTQFGARGRIFVDNIVPEDAKSVIACKEGNVVALGNLFESGRASIKDVTSDFRPLFGSTETVRFLLDRGADATVVAGPYHTELLSRAFFHRHVEISRLLLQKETIDHINSAGLTPLANLFNPGAIGPVCSELLDMLFCHGFSNLNVQDEDGLTALHRAAAYGTSQDVQYLLRHGADTSLKTIRHLWTPIFSAVSYDNRETFRELLTIEQHSSIPILNQVDLEGWTLLHVAASHGSFRIIPLLLQAEANPHTLSMPTTKNHSFCDEVADRQVTPLDLVLAHHGNEGLKRFEEELRKVGLDTEYNEGDIFWSFEEA